jgi:hypothetical protein
MKLLNLEGTSMFSRCVMVVVTTFLFLWFTPAAALTRWNANGDFAFSPMDTGNIQAWCYVNAPWGNQSWGMEGATFNSSDRKLDWQRYAIWSTQNAYLYGKEQRGYWGFVRYIQGDVWGGTNCGAIPWKRPTPLAIAGKTLTMKLDLFRDNHTFLTTNNSWVMQAINVWVSASDFPKAGGDLNGKKPLVLDLAFFQQCNWSGCGLSNFEDGSAYHYQALLSTTPSPLRQWKTWKFNLGTYINQALSKFGLPAKNAKVYQVEYVIELHNADGAATIDNFYLEY